MKAILILIVYEMMSISTAYAQESQVEANIEMYKTTWHKIINKGEIDEINRENFDEDILMVYSPEDVVGIEEFRAYYQNFLTGFSDRKFTIIDVYGQGDKLVKHWQFQGTHTGDFFGIPPTGKTVNIEGVTLVEMKNGRIFREQDFMDNTVFMQQLGITSDPKNMQVISELYEAFSAGNIPAVLRAMAPDIEWKEAEGNGYADGNPYSGPDAILQGIFVRIGEDHEYFRLQDLEMHEMSDNKVLVTLRYDAQWKGGEDYNAQAAHLWSLKKGKIVAFQQYVDTKKLDETFRQN